MEYALVHLHYTIPLAGLLYFIGGPLRTRRERYRTNALIAIAVLSTTPWDSYLIKHKIWSYPPNAIIGPTLFSIPAEEYFFFFVQTYITSSLYALCSRPLVHSVYLQPKANRKLQLTIGALILALFGLSLNLFIDGGKGTYLALILLWCLPFLLLLWTLAYTHIVALPWTATVLPIALPTLFLWLVDTFALRRGTWVIENGTKLGIHLWPHLEIEEAIFFLVTNLMIVFGHVAADLAFAVCDTFPEVLPGHITSSVPPILLTLRAITLPCSAYPAARLEAIQESLAILHDKSKSFSTASMLFEGRLRLQLLSLYAICRVADDAIDEATSPAEAQQNLLNCQTYFRHACSPTPDAEKLSILLSHCLPQHQPALSLLPFLELPYQPFSDLLAGFSTDLLFPEPQIHTAADLKLYAEQVASSVAELSVLLACKVYSHKLEAETLAQARIMGSALQYVNIARDVPEDARKGRCYLPGRTGKEAMSELTSDRFKLLDLADQMGGSIDAIDALPQEVRLGMRSACAVYLEVGKKVRLALKEGRIGERARVGKWQRVGVLLRVIRHGR